MKVSIKGNTCIVTREPGDPVCRGVVNGAGESRLLHHVKNKLNESGKYGRLIKKRMHKDGHLVCDSQQYIRSANVNKPGALAILNGNYSIRGAEEDFNKNGQVALSVVYFSD